MGLFSKLKQHKNQDQVKYEKGLAKSRKTFKEKLAVLFASNKKVDEEFFENLLDILIESDIGASLSNALVNETKKECKIKGIEDPEEIYETLVFKMREFYLDEMELSSEINYASSGPSVILVIGVNGVGKTTSIAKLTNMILKEGKKVLLVAGDTFRAGAVEQLSIWADRLGVDLVSGKLNGDPSSVIYDGIDKAIKENYDVVICDTAGRLQTKSNLMQELDKIHRVMQKLISDAPHEAFLVIDATMGQNGVYQAASFNEVTSLSGIILTKMDSSSKGGIILSIKNNLGIPVRYIGLGEKIDDLSKFDLDSYLWGLLKEGEND